MQEYDSVALIVDRDDIGLKKGQVGAIVDRLGENDFMVEFVNHRTGYTYALTDLPRSQLMKLVYEGEGIGAAAA